MDLFRIDCSQKLFPVKVFLICNFSLAVVLGENLLAKTNSNISLLLQQELTPLFIRREGLAKRTEVKTLFRSVFPCDLRKRNHSY
jgi:hypothetical protein